VQPHHQWEFVLSKRQVIDRGTFVPFLLEVITNHIGANANRLYQNEFGVGLAEWRVLSAVAIEPGTTAMALSIQSGIDAAAVSRVVYAMTESGLLSQEVDRADRRRRKLTLTKRGTLLHTAMLKTALIEEERLLHAISSEERRALISILQKLYARLGDRIPKIPATANDEQD
jgi:DNA-binding MarR family transcriptional regulator